MTHADAGLALLDMVRGILELEPERVTERERGLEWWPHSHIMRFTATPPRPDGAVVVAVETPLLGGLAPSAALFGKLAFRNARDPGLSALRWDSTTGEVSLRAAVIARPGGPDLPVAQRLSHAAMLQVGDAVRTADSLAVEFPEARLLTSAPPQPGLEAVPQVEAWQAYAEQGAALATDLAAQVASAAGLSPAPWLRVTRAPHGIDAEIACAPDHERTGPGQGVALLRVSAAQSHPRLGPGLVMVLVPPPDTEPKPERAPATAVLLNEAEAREWTGVDALGGWCVHPSSGLSHVTFMPAIVLHEDTLGVLAWQAGIRARWAVGLCARVEAMRASRGGATPPGD